LGRACGASSLGPFRRASMPGGGIAFRCPYAGRAENGGHLERGASSARPDRRPASMHNTPLEPLWADRGLRGMWGMRERPRSREPRSSGRLCMIGEPPRAGGAAPTLSRCPPFNRPAAEADDGNAIPRPRTDARPHGGRGDGPARHPCLPSRTRPPLPRHVPRMPRSGPHTRCDRHTLGLAVIRPARTYCFGHDEEPTADRNRGQLDRTRGWLIA
jgi:hypothetical protein